FFMQKLLYGSEQDRSLASEVLIKIDVTANAVAQLIRNLESIQKEPIIKNFLTALESITPVNNLPLNFNVDLFGILKNDQLALETKKIAIRIIEKCFDVVNAKKDTYLQQDLVEIFVSLDDEEIQSVVIRMIKLVAGDEGIGRFLDEWFKKDFFKSMINGKARSLKRKAVKLAKRNGEMEVQRKTEIAELVEEMDSINTKLLYEQLGINSTIDNLFQPATQVFDEISQQVVKLEQIELKHRKLIIDHLMKILDNEKLTDEDLRFQLEDILGKIIVGNKGAKIIFYDRLLKDIEKIDNINVMASRGRCLTAICRDDLEYTKKASMQIMKLLNNLDFKNEDVRKGLEGILIEIVGVNENLIKQLLGEIKMKNVSDMFITASYINILIAFMDKKISESLRRQLAIKKSAIINKQSAVIFRRGNGGESLLRRTSSYVFGEEEAHKQKYTFHDYTITRDFIAGKKDFLFTGELECIEEIQADRRYCLSFLKTFRGLQAYLIEDFNANYYTELSCLAGVDGEKGFNLHVGLYNDLEKGKDMRLLIWFRCLLAKISLDYDLKWSDGEIMTKAFVVFNKYVKDKKQDGWKELKDSCEYMYLDLLADKFPVEMIEQENQGQMLSEKYIQDGGINIKQAFLDIIDLYEQILRGQQSIDLTLIVDLTLNNFDSDQSGLKEELSSLQEAYIATVKAA
ncbi:hypothetical protein KKC59_01640, partial [bacterium]|nr:hypothetical protein [bacterium]